MGDVINKYVFLQTHKMVSEYIFQLPSKINNKDECGEPFSIERTGCNQSLQLIF